MEEHPAGVAEYEDPSRGHPRRRASSPFKPHCPDTTAALPSMEGAACISPGVDPEWFFTAEREDRPTWSRQRVKNLNKYRQYHAVKTCQGCPVRQLCLEENLTVPYGIFGGLGPAARFALAAERGISTQQPTYDEVVVERMMAGDLTGEKVRQADRHEAIRRLRRAGVSYNDIEALTKASGTTITLAIQAAA